MKPKGLAIVVLAAGKGTRMKSSLAKVLQPLKNQPLLNYVLQSIAPLHPDLSIVIVGFQSANVKAAFQDRGLIFVEQKEQLGTGHAVEQAKHILEDFSGDTLVICGDMPFIKSSTLTDLINKHREKKAYCTILTIKTSIKKDFGRIIRNEFGLLSKIVENHEASEDEKKVDEYNSGVYCFDNSMIYKALGFSGNNNIQKEYYLTDTIEYIVKTGLTVETLQSSDVIQFLGVNSQEDLRLAEHILTRQTGPPEITPRHKKVIKDEV